MEISTDVLKKYAEEIIQYAAADISFVSVGEALNMYEEFAVLDSEEFNNYMVKVDDLVLQAKITVTWE